MKKYIASKMCKSIDEIKMAISEFLNELTPSKCHSYISHLYEVNNIQIDFLTLNINLSNCLKVIKVVIQKQGGWSNM